METAIAAITDIDLSHATRVPLWNIPTYFQIIMYLLFLLSLILLFRNLYRHYIFIMKGVFTEHLLPSRFVDLNFKKFFKTIFLQGRVINDLYAGIFHSMIFYGFLTHLLATITVMIHLDTPFKIFNGYIYIVVSFLADLGGVSMILGIALAMFRRYFLKPKYLQHLQLQLQLPSSDLSYWYLYLMLIFFVVIGFSLEGIRIFLTDPITQALTYEKYFSPFGWVIAKLFSYFCGYNEGHEILLSSHKILWMIHMVSTMVFIALMGSSKFLHLLLLPFSALVTPDRQSALILPMNFQDESAETFGLGDSKDLNRKERLDVLACVDCGRCTKVCPAQASGKPLDPKMILAKLKDLKVLNDLKQKDGSLFSEENPLFKSDELDSCTTCGACSQQCPANVEHIKMITNLKRFKVLTLSDIHPSAASTINKIKMHGNPWGIPQSERFNWAQSLEVDLPIIKENKRVEYLFYVGCAGALDPLGQNITKKMIRLLKKCNVDFAVIEKNERCTGDSIRRFGDEYSFDEWAKDNIKFLRQFSFDKILTFCPHCLHTLGKEYGKFSNKDLDGNFKVIHHTELFSSLINSGKIIPKGLVGDKKESKEFTYHDPCYLGRHHGLYRPAREILAAIPGLKLKELINNREESVCCGMGGGNMWYEISEGDHLAINRLKEIASINVNKVITSCPFCMINFNSSKGRYSATENIEIKDIFTVLDESI
ncbi:MAG: (Fe-S)-binding protein [Oligoflexia bacterium]|nr:(Fe-S)-binding protein [Oligoflexia bacterium]